MQIHPHLHGVQWVTPSITVQIKASPKQVFPLRVTGSKREKMNTGQWNRDWVYLFDLCNSPSLEVITHPHGVWLNLVVCKCDHTHALILL